MAEHVLHPHETDLLNRLRLRRRKKPESRPEDRLSWGDQLADNVASAVGSWPFIVLQSTLLAIWLLLNGLNVIEWDPFPFILLNLILSFQAAYTAPVIMMSQNRQSNIDRGRAIDDYQVNVKAELEIELLHQKIDVMREQEIAKLTEIVNRLMDHLERGEPLRGPKTS